MSTRAPVAERRAARAADRRRNVARQYARARSTTDVAGVEFDRVRAAIKAISRRDPEAAEQAAGDLVAVLSQLAGCLEGRRR